MKVWVAQCNGCKFIGSEKEGFFVETTGEYICKKCVEKNNRKVRGRKQ